MKRKGQTEELQYPSTMSKMKRLVSCQQELKHEATKSEMCFEDDIKMSDGSRKFKHKMQMAVQRGHSRTKILFQQCRTTKLTDGGGEKYTGQHAQSERRHSESARWS